ncbi:MAG TPA: alcohol dehydrogenase catalytic domain-containing protein [Anaeromyxobacteraceae bacterium]|nr:alcohol dehydrogenase catalytic domain-containing protein [Anaeromyxobacteraceae bacterium]
MESPTLPSTQYALQLVGPSRLALNTEKPVDRPGPTQVLARVECVGLCFSDMKLLKQFDQHARKSEVKTGLSAEVLREIPSYVPGGKPTVPGHEVTARIVAVGERVTRHRVGERVLVQTDYRGLATAASNAAFGYNFEGGLQEYVLMDERVIVDASGERFLLPVPDHRSASALALVEPWSCVEDSYVTVERQGPKPGGRLLVVADAGATLGGLSTLAAAHPQSVTAVWADPAQGRALSAAHLEAAPAAHPSALPAEAFDDIVYFGSDKAVIELLNDKLAVRGLFNLVLGGKRVGASVNVGVGRVHYGLTRWTGTLGSDCAVSYRHIPRSGELRPGERVAVIGAGGAMGQMHVLRAVAAGIEQVSVTGTDMDQVRLDALYAKAGPLAKSRHVPLNLVNTKTTVARGPFSYFALMAPVGALVANAIEDAADLALINIFAGIPAGVKHELDLDTYVARRVYLFGTSGSTIDDMKIVLAKVVSGTFDTDVSVDAISGMRGAEAGIAALENRTLAGKIMVYPWLKDAFLIPLKDLAATFPTVARKLDSGKWCKAAEDELKRIGHFAE